MVPKIIFKILVLGLLLCFASCSKKGSDSTTSTTTPQLFNTQCDGQSCLK